MADASVSDTLGSSVCLCQSTALITERTGALWLTLQMIR
jgi:hypothetical protein